MLAAMTARTNLGVTMIIPEDEALPITTKLTEEDELVPSTSNCMRPRKREVMPIQWHRSH